MIGHDVCDLSNSVEHRHIIPYTDKKKRGGITPPHSTRVEPNPHIKTKMVTSTIAAPIASSAATIPTVFQIIDLLSVHGVFLTVI